MNKITNLKKNCINLLNLYNTKKEFICCVCNNKKNMYVTYSNTGRKRLLCRCGTRERQRGLLFLILFHTEIFNKQNLNVLHTSPAFELNLIKLIKHHNPSLNYITSDIKDKTCDLLLDLVNIPQDKYNTYNYIINIHVLEHIRIKKNVYIVINNIYNMLTDRGKAIIAVPQDFKLDVDILEDPNADPNPDHWRKFGCKFVDLLNKFTKVEIIYDTSFKNINEKFIQNKKTYKDLFLDKLKIINSYVDGQVFYICHK